jgi:hypothetical protein
VRELPDLVGAPEAHVFGALCRHVCLLVRSISPVRSCDGSRLTYT